MGLATVEELLAARLRTRKVPTPEVGEDKYVYVRMLPNSAYDEVVGLAKMEERIFRERLCLLCLADENGAPYFNGDSGPEVLENVPLPIINRVAEAALEINGFSSEDTAGK